MDHAAGAEKQAGLEKSVRIKVEDGDAVRADADRDEHESELRDRRIREDFFDVGLYDGDRCREERGRNADESDHLRGLRCVQIDAGQACGHVDAGGHHRRGVNERRHRRRSRHGVRQPDVQRNLRRLAGGADEQQDADQTRRNRGKRAAQECGVDPVHVERADRLVQQEHAEQETGIADAVGDERLLAGTGFVGVLEPEADEKIRRKADAFPADKQHQQRLA